MNVTSGKTWSMKGETPVIERSGKRDRLLMVSAVSRRGRLFFRTYTEGSMTGERYVQFLKDLQRFFKRKVYVIHDGFSAHKGKIAQAFLKEKESVECFQLPGYSPDLNPDEWVWEYAKREMRKKVHPTKNILRRNAQKVLRKLQRNPKMLRKFFGRTYPWLCHPI